MGEQQHSKPKLVATVLILIVLSLAITYIWWSSAAPVTPNTVQYSQSVNPETEVSDETHLLPIEPKQPSSSDTGTSVDDREALYRATIRKEFQKSEDLPNGISFSTTLASLMHLRLTNPDEATQIVMQEMDINRNDALEVTNMLSSAFKSFRRQVTEGKRGALCDGDVPRVYGEKVYALFERMDDYQDAVAEQYYLAVIQKMSKTNSKKFQDWIDRAKLSTVSTRFNHKEYYEYSGAIGDTRAAELCLAWSTLDQRSQ
jgi:hypothetical protein